jgi:hypothetical protein
MYLTLFSITYHNVALQVQYISGVGCETKLEIKVVLPIASLPVGLVLHDVLAPVHLRYLLSARCILRRFVLPNSEGNKIHI